MKREDRPHGQKVPLNINPEPGGHLRLYTKKIKKKNGKSRLWTMVTMALLKDSKLLIKKAI